MSNNEFEVVRGRGNIYADLGEPDADTKLMKAQLAADIIGILDDRKISAPNIEVKLTFSMRHAGTNKRVGK